MSSFWVALTKRLAVLVVLTALGIVAVMEAPFLHADGQRSGPGTSPVRSSGPGVPGKAPGPSSGAPAASVASAGPSWFALDPSLAASWNVRPDPSNQWALQLERRAPFPGNPKRIFALYSKAGSAFDLGMQTVVRDFDSKKLPAVYTVANWNGDAQAAQRWLDVAEQGHYDLILSMGSESTAFLHDHDTAGRVPVVTVVSKDPVLLGQMRDYTHGSGTSIAYTSVSVPIDLQMAYLLQMKPGLKNVGVMYEQSNTSAVDTQVTPLRKAAAARNIQTIDVVVVDTKNAPQELETKVPEAVRRMQASDPQEQNSIFLVTGSTSVFTAIATINKVAGNVPVVSMFPELVQPGDDSAALSIGVSFETSAHLSAQYAADILQGRAKASDLPVGVVTPPDIAVNFLKAKEIGLKVPFGFFESSSLVYDTSGKLVRAAGQAVP